MANSSVRTRQELINHFDERMNLTYDSLSEIQELEPDTSLIKTYLIEAHLPENAPVEEVGQLVSKLSTTPIARDHRLTVKQSDDDT